MSKSKPTEIHDWRTVRFPCGVELARDGDNQIVLTADLAGGVAVSPDQAIRIAEFLVGETFEGLCLRRELVRLKLLEATVVDVSPATGRIDLEAVRAAVDLIEDLSRQIVESNSRKDKTIDESVADNAADAAELVRNTVIVGRLRCMLGAAS